VPGLGLVNANANAGRAASGGDDVAVAAAAWPALSAAAGCGCTGTGTGTASACGLGLGASSTNGTAGGADAEELLLSLRGLVSLSLLDRTRSSSEGRALSRGRSPGCMHKQLSPAMRCDTTRHDRLYQVQCGADGWLEVG
jgi:hypothetical protein